MPSERVEPPLSLRTGQLAAAAGVSLQTLRYYERRGLLKPAGRRPSGYREYAPDAVRRIRFIKRAQELGFTLREIQELLALRAGPAGQRERTRTAVAGKLTEMDGKIRDLKAMRKTLAELADACACGETTENCPILAALEGAAPLEKKSRRKNHGNF